MNVVHQPTQRGRLAKNLATRPDTAGKTGCFARKMPPAASAAHNSRRPISWPMGQFFTRHLGRLAATGALEAFAALFPACSGNSNSTTAAPAAKRQEAVASIRNQPAGFNRHTRNDAATDLLSALTQAKLVRINKV